MACFKPDGREFTLSTRDNEVFAPDRRGESKG